MIGLILIFMTISLNFAQADSGVTSTSITASSNTGVTIATRFNDFYTEETGLSKAETLASYMQLRSGYNLYSNFQTYAAFRLGADTRTVLDQSDAVYNDNYVFFGLGIDYLGLLPGVRLTTQVGASEDLNSKIHLGGVDTRTGLVTYHEWRYGQSPFNMEFYSEGFYIRRYRNIMASGQARLFYDVFKIPLSISFLGKQPQSLEAAPMVNFVSGVDSAGYDYNRFNELRLGLRVRLRSASSFMLIPYYVIGSRWHRPTEFPTYRDIRGLLAFYTTF